MKFLDRLMKLRDWVIILLCLYAWYLTTAIERLREINKDMSRCIGYECRYPFQGYIDLPDPLAFQLCDKIERMRVLNTNGWYSATYIIKGVDE